MTALDIWSAAKPRIHCLHKNDPPHMVGAIPPAGTLFVAVIDCGLLRSAEDIFREFDNQYRFPAYFGWNWAALSDCLRDLNWLPADRYLLVLENADQLQLHPEDRDRLMHVLERAADEWCEPLPGSYGNPFNVLILSSSDPTDQMM